MCTRLRRHARCRWRRNNAWRAWERTSSREIMTCPVRIYSLERNLLHLADGTSVLRRDLTLINFPNYERCRGNPSDRVGQNNFGSICYWLRPSRGNIFSTYVSVLRPNRERGHRAHTYRTSFCWSSQNVHIEGRPGHITCAQMGVVNGHVLGAYSL